MKSGSILDQRKFWEIIKYLVELDAKKSFEDICSELQINKRQLNSFITFLKEVNCQLELSSTEKGKVLNPPKKQNKIEVEFTLLEWLQFQAHFPALSSLEQKPYHEDLKSKLIEIENKYKKSDLFKPLPTLEKLNENKLYGAKHLSLVSEQGDTNLIVEQIEDALLEGDILALQIDDKVHKVFPRKIVFFDGDFNLIGENIVDQSLLNIKISFIQNLESFTEDWHSEFSDIEIDDFVSSLRQMSDNSVRLVLKVYNRQNFSLDLDYQFFENPCVFSNPLGEYIWAATIEPNNKIYQWLFELGEDIEILDPKDFKLEFLKYCENKLKKLA